MAWYAAHAIMYVKFKDGLQDKYPCWENIILIEAKTADEAFQKAEARAREDEGDSQGTFTHQGRPASWVFAGIRRLVSCTDPLDQPTDGTEITYLEMEVEREDCFTQFLNGKLAQVLYE